MKRSASTILFSVMFFAAVCIQAAAGGTYYSVTGMTNPTLTSSWNTTGSPGIGTTPNNFTSGDIFILQSGHTMTMNGSVWTISGANSELQVNGALVVNPTSSVGANFLKITSSGTVTITAGNNLTLNNANGAADDLIVEGILNNAGSVSYSGGATGFVTGRYNHTANGGTIPAFTWSGNAICAVTGVTNAATLSGLNQSFREFRWNSPSQTSAVQLNSQLTTVNKLLWIQSTGTGSIVLFNSSANLFAAYFDMTGGTVDFTTAAGLLPTVTINSTGTAFSQSAGATIKTSGIGSAGLFKIGSDVNYISQVGTIGSGKVGFHLLPGSFVDPSNSDINVTGDFIIDSAAVFGFNNSTNYKIAGTGNFELRKNGSLYIWDDSGLTVAPAASGAVQTSTRSFSSEANYFFWGGTQVTGAGAPDTYYGTVEIWAGTSVTLSKNTTIYGNLTIIDVPLKIASYTLDLRGDVHDSLYSVTKGFFQSNTGGTVIYNKSSAGQKVITNNSQYSNLTFNNFSKDVGDGVMYIDLVFDPGTATHSVSASNTIEFNNGNSQTLPVLSGGVPYQNIVLNKNDGGLSAGGAVTLNGNLNLLLGNLYDNGYVITVKGNILHTSGYHTSNTGGKILLTGGSSQHTIGDAVLGTLEIDDVLGAATTGAPVVQDLILTNGSFILTSPLNILAGGTITATSGELNSSDYVVFQGSGTVSGSVSFSMVEIYGSVNFGSGSTISTSLAVKAGGYVVTNPPTFGENSTLIYSTGGTVYSGPEWSSTSGAGFPYHVHIMDSTMVMLGSDSPNVARETAGNLTIDAGSHLSMNTDGWEMSEPLTVNGSILCNGILTLSSIPGGGLFVKGDYANNGTLTPYTRPVTFNGSALQLITRSSAGTIYFDSLVIDNSDVVKVDNSSAISLSITKNLTLKNGLLRLDGTITDFAAYTTINAAAGNFDTLSNDINFYGSMTVSGTVDFGNLQLFGTVNFGSDSRLHGIMRINTGGTINVNPPVYLTGSTLIYNSGSTYYRGPEWSALSGPGHPFNVEIDNYTLLNFGGINETLPSSMNGTLVVMAGSALSMNEDGWELSAPLTVNGSIVNYGDIILSSLDGNELKIQGSFTQSGGTITTNNNRVTFFGSGNSTIESVPMLDKLKMDKSSGGLTLVNNDIVITDTLFLDGGNINTGANAVEVSSAGAVIRTNGHINGTQKTTVAPGANITRTFEIGDAAAYAPVSVTFGNVSTGDYLSASTSITGPPLTGSYLNSAKNVNRFWTLTSGAIAYDYFNATLVFDPADIDAGADPDIFTLWRYSDATWIDLTEGTRTPTSIQGTGITGMNIFAAGELVTYTITASAGSNGTITPSGALEVYHGSDTSFTITPDPGYLVDSVTVDGVSFWAITNYTFNNVTAPHTIDASFKVFTPTLSINAINGTVLKDPDQPTYAYNSNVTITAVSNPGYEFSMWIGDASGIANPYSVTMDGNKYITAMFNFSALVPPTAPTGLYAIAGNGMVQLKWKKNPQEDILRYRIYGDLFAGPTTLLDSTFTTTDTTKFIGGLVNGSTYYFRIVAVDSAGNPSPYSLEDAATPMPEPGHAITLDGFGDYAEGSNPNLPQGNSPRTIEAWIKTTASSDQVIANWGSLNNNERAALLIVNGIPKYVGQSNDLTGTIPVHDGEWHHVAAAFDGTDLSIYVDGNLDISSPATFNTTGTTLRVGERIAGDAVDEYFDGQIDEVRIWNIGRMQTDIQYTKDKSVYGDESGLVAYYRFDELSGSLSFDGSPASSDLSIVGDANFVTSGAMIPSVPAGLLAIPGETQIDLAWNRNPEFDIYRYLVYGGATANPTDLVDSTAFGDPADTTVTITGLTNYTDYYFRVKAVDSTGIESQYSADIMSHPIDLTPLPPVDTVIILDSAQANFTLSWSKVIGTEFASYRIYGGTDIEIVTQIDSLFDINDTSAVIPGLTAGITYVFYVTSIDTNGNESGTNDIVKATPYLYIPIVADKSGNGTITPMDTTWVSPTDTLSFVIAPSAGHHIDSVVVDSVNVGAVSSYAFENISISHTIKAFFSINVYQITAYAVGNGSIAPPETSYVFHGDSLVVSATADDFHHIDSVVTGGMAVLYGGDPGDSAMTYTFVNVTSNQSITAYFSANPNIPPYFVTVLPDTAIARFDTLQFQYSANDPETDSVRYFLLTAPGGASIDSVTGLLTYAPLPSTSGTFTIVVQIFDDSTSVNDTTLVRVNLYGDVSGNGTVTAFDAAKILQHTVNIDTLDALQLRIGDVSGNLSLSALDASYILQYSVGLISSFPGGLGKSAQVDAVLAAFSFRIEKGKNADEYDLFVSVNKPSNVYGVIMHLKFDSALVTAVGMSKTALSDSMSMAYAIPAGHAKIALAGISPMNTAGDVAKCTFILKDKNYPKNATLFTMEKFVLNETDHTNDIGGITLNVRGLAGLPTVYALSQNFPNPFNPATTINYELPELSSVKITVYNILGQEVRTLMNEQQPAGYYSVQWNGTNNGNTPVASGMYIYRIEAAGGTNNRFAQVKKMMLLK